MLDRLGLIEVGHLFSEVARPGVNDKIHVAIIVTVKLDEMVAAAERPDCLVDSAAVFEVAVTVKRGDNLLGLAIDFHFLAYQLFEPKPVLAHDLPRRHIAADVLMKSMEVDIVELSEFQYPHSAAYVDPDDVGDNLVTKITGKADYTPAPGMDIGHNADFFIREHVNRQQFLYLGNSIVVNIVSENFHVIAFNCFHII